MASPARSVVELPTPESTPSKRKRTNNGSAQTATPKRRRRTRGLSSVQVTPARRTDLGITEGDRDEDKAAPTAGSSGFIGDAVARGEPREENTQDEDKRARVEDVVMQYAKVAFFRNFGLEPGDLREIVEEHIASDSWRFKVIIDKAERWRVNWQGAMFGSWFADYVSFRVASRPVDSSES
jgi:hypothetical protein